MASVPGSFAYMPPAGTILSAGQGQQLSATFIPTDTTDYTTAPASTTIHVLTATPTFSTLSCADDHRRHRHDNPLRPGRRGTLIPSGSVAITLGIVTMNHVNATTGAFSAVFTASALAVPPRPTRSPTASLGTRTSPWPAQATRSPSHRCVRDGRRGVGLLGHGGHGRASDRGGRPPAASGRQKHRLALAGHQQDQHHPERAGDACRPATSP